MSNHTLFVRIIECVHCRTILTHFKTCYHVHHTQFRFQGKRIKRNSMAGSSMIMTNEINATITNTLMRSCRFDMRPNCTKNIYYVVVGFPTFLKHIAPFWMKFFIFQISIIIQIEEKKNGFIQKIPKFEWKSTFCRTKNTASSILYKNEITLCSIDSKV